jgi:hypothetical protein
MAVVSKGLQLNVGVGRVDLRNDRGVLGVVAGNARSAPIASPPHIWSAPRFRIASRHNRAIARRHPHPPF